MTNLTPTQVQLLRDIQESGNILSYDWNDGKFRLKSGQVVSSEDSIAIYDLKFVRLTEKPLVDYFELGPKAIAYLSNLDTQENGRVD